MTDEEKKELTALFEGLHFRKKIIGGVDEMDVWRQIREVQRKYEMLLRIKEEKSSALLEERDACIRQMKRQLSGRKAERGEAGE